MFAALTFFEYAVSLLLVGVWGIAAVVVDGLAVRRFRRGLRFGARSGVVLIALGLVLVLVRVGTTLGLWSLGWWFAHDRVTIVLPLLLVPAVAVLGGTVPRLWGIARQSTADRGTPLTAADRRALADPTLVVPVQATALGAAVGVYLTFFPLFAPSLGEAVVLALLFAAANAVLWAWQRRRCRALSQPEPRVRRRLGGLLLRATTVVLVVAVGSASWLAVSLRASQLPERMSMMGHSNVDVGGGPAGEPQHGEGTVDLTNLAGPRDGEPDHRFTLIAQASQVRLSSGRTVDAWTFNGQAPGPELRVRQGDLVEVTLRNDLPNANVTIHWHGVDVPNAEDGVAGLTQDAVRPGEHYTYRFRAPDVGTFWYHSHQASSVQVKKGLFGALLVLPKDVPPADEQRDVTVLAHAWETPDGAVATLNTSDALDRYAVPPGTPVRLRLINTANDQATFTLTGAPFRVAAIDGTDFTAPTALTDAQLNVAAGGRYDLSFTMPDGPVRLGLPGGLSLAADNPELGIMLSPDGTGVLPPIAKGPVFDPATYGGAAPTPFDATSRFDREFEMVLGQRFGFFDGTFHFLYTINGEVFPDTPTQLVRAGDLVKATFVNRSFIDHPMHLHGHHALVLSRNGAAVSGSPWWVDTLNVAPGETYEIAFRADNPGLWMDHCHNLEHAAIGMTMHLAYEGVTTPFAVGPATGNQPE